MKSHTHSIETRHALIIESDLRLLEEGKQQGAREFLDRRLDTGLSNGNQDLFDLWTEIGIFLTHGDLRPS